MPVILYHFTSLWNLGNVGPDNILAVGLKAFPANWPDLLGRTVVWLTSDPDMPDGLCAQHDMRIALKIPSHDRKLIHVHKLLKKKLPQWAIDNLDRTSAQHGGDWRTFYIYEGDIPLEYFHKTNPNEFVGGAITFASEEAVRECVEPERLEEFTKRLAAQPDRAPSWWKSSVAA
jgi:hypothetical protein